MALPFYKLFSLSIRVFSRPVVSYVKSMQLNKHGVSNSLIHMAFVKLGNAHNNI